MSFPALLASKYYINVGRKSQGFVIGGVYPGSDDFTIEGNNLMFCEKDKKELDIYR